MNWVDSNANINMKYFIYNLNEYLSVNESRKDEEKKRVQENVKAKSAITKPKIKPDESSYPVGRTIMRYIIQIGIFRPMYVMTCRRSIRTSWLSV